MDSLLCAMLRIRGFFCNFEIVNIDARISSDIGYGKRMGILLLLFFIGYIFMALAQGVATVAGVQGRALILTTTTLQDLLVFILPAFAVAMLDGAKRGMKSIGVTPAPITLPFFSVILVYFIALPAMNQLIDWNANMHLPDSMDALEKQLRAWEDAAQQITLSIFTGTSVGVLISGILIVGVLTGFAEESFFRGGIQRILFKLRLNRHLAIWITAFIFSAVHFQFFGFIPRLLLGAWFGYLYWWTGSLWLPVFAHALNNSMAVAGAWLTANNLISFNPDTFGVSDGFPLLALLSALAVTVVLIYRRHCFPAAPAKLQ